ncbi:MAG: hypothetical protein OJF51_000323 [Nitrospira sp.]|jgi:hypothetical protein|nr:MAG: hypothetical protein OJF51_000319 [Nitrospira sp.]WHZ25528.1 MAG: hypothetical protein OJF51_000323 [Nitrospira sp.]
MRNALRRCTRRHILISEPIRLEKQLLLCCIRPFLDSEEVKRLAVLLKQDIDWEYLVRIALAQQVLPQLYRTLQSTPPNAVPRGILDQLRYQLQKNTEWNLFVSHIFINLLQLFERNGIPTIPFKGPTLAASVYGNLGLRQFADLDILVRESDYPNAQQLLSAMGFSRVKQFEWESTFVGGKYAIAVDLHKRMTSQEFSCPLDFEYLLKRLKSVVIDGIKVGTLSPEVTLLMLAVQITKDAGTPYLQLIKICDIDQLFRAHLDFDLRGTLSQANELGCERMVLFSLCLAHHLLGTPLPQEILDEAHAQPVIHQLVEFTRRRLFDGPDWGANDRRSIDLFRWHVRERVRDKLHPYYIRYVHATFVPCSLDGQLLSLPERFAFLHYIIRPIRLTCKYGLLFLRGRIERNVP